jgi:hypothetical protein
MVICLLRKLFCGCVLCTLLDLAIFDWDILFFLIIGTQVVVLQQVHQITSNPQVNKDKVVLYRSIPLLQGMTKPLFLVLLDISVVMETLHTHTHTKDHQTTSQSPQISLGQPLPSIPLFQVGSLPQGSLSQVFRPGPATGTESSSPFSPMEVPQRPGLVST